MVSRFSFAAAILISLASANAVASERYGTPPPAVVSPDLTAPWVMQLRKSPVGVTRRKLIVRPAPAETPARGIFKRKKKQEFVPVAAPKPRRAMPKMDPKFLPATVEYSGPHKAGTIYIDTVERYLYLVLKDGKARRYGVGVGKPGFEWAGSHKVTQKREWPDWRPPAEMIAREKAKGNILPVHMAGGPANPLGARALYLGSTLYRIHGTNAPWTIGGAVSSGCIRMRNEDVMELYEMVSVGAKVVVR